MGRFVSPDAFWKDSHPEDPQSWDEYTYARNNPLKYVDPTGENALVSAECSQDANAHPVCHVSVTASIAIYAAPGNNFTDREMQGFADQMKQGIQDAWNGTTSMDGVDVTVNVNVSISVASSKDAAMKSGADNVIGLTTGMAKPGDAVSVTDPHGMFAGKSPDTGIWSVNFGGGLKAQSAHEFGRLLSAVESNSDRDLMDSGLGQLARTDHLHATQADYLQVFYFGVHSASLEYNTGSPPWRQRVTAASNPEVNINAVWIAITGARH
jgi:hypothetical protein